MKLKTWIKQIDPIVDVVIWGDSSTEPLFEGSMLNIPWHLVDLPIGRKNKADTDEPIYISIDKNEFGIEQPTITINVIE